MSFPIRCFSCNKVIGNKYEEYKANIESGLSPSEALTIAGARRYCCRRMFLGHTELSDKLIVNSDKKTDK